MSNRMRVTPCACVSHDDQNGRLQIELELPGVDKKDIRLEMRSDSLCVTAPRGKDTEYSGCFTPLLHKDAVESTAYPHKKAISTLLPPAQAPPQLPARRVLQLGERGFCPGGRASWPGGRIPSPVE